MMNACAFKLMQPGMGDHTGVVRFAVSERHSFRDPVRKLLVVCILMGAC